MLIGHRAQIQEALSSDFGVHPPLAADLIEMLGPAGRAASAAEQLPSWMAAEPRPTDPALYGSGRAYVQPQPKGVIGNIVPWNFPFDLSVGPLDRDARRRQPRRDQAVGVHAGVRRAAARDGPRDVRPRPRRRRRRRPRARTRVHARALGSPALHRQPGGRPRDRQGGGRAARAGHARARRQVPGDPRPPTASMPSRSSRCSRRRRSRTGRCASRSTTASCRARSSRSSPRSPPTYARESMPGYCESDQLHRDRLHPPPTSASRACSRTPARAAATCARWKQAGRRRSRPRGSCRSRS